MKRLRMTELGFVVLIWVAFSILAIGCTDSGETTSAQSGSSGGGSADVNVDISALSANDISMIHVTVSSDDFSPITGELTKSPENIWSATVEQIPAGENRTFLAEAFDSQGTVIYSGSASGVTIMEGQVADITIYLQQTAPAVPFINSVPVITAFTASSKYTTPNGTISLTAEAMDADPEDTLTFVWSADSGNFSDTDSAETVWTAPTRSGEVNITVLVSDANGAAASLTATVVVSFDEATGDANVSITLNTAPEVPALTASPTRIDTEESTVLDLTAIDRDGDDLTVDWTADCDGVFDDTAIEDPTFTLGNRDKDTCTLTATVTDSMGEANTASITIEIGPGVSVEFGSTDAPNDNTEVYLASEDPGFSYASRGSDYDAAQEYYVLKNSLIQIGVTPYAAANNSVGTLTAGAVTDMVALSCNRENVDWSAMYLHSGMDSNWNESAERGLPLSNIWIEGETIVANGVANQNSSITAELVYSLVDDKLGVIRMDLTLTNTSDTDYHGYFEYLFDPDESGEQVSYTPGVGYTTKKSTVITTGWDKNYLFNGPYGKITGNTAHTIIWPDDQQPEALVNEGYISGAWFNADIEAKGSKTITFYHAVTVPQNAEAPYEEAETIAFLVSNGIDINGYDFLTGTVSDDDTNVPVANAIVVAKYPIANYQGEVVGTTTTDTDGNYAMFIPKDVYTLTVSSLDYSQQSLSIDMTKVEPKLDIQLQKFSGARATGNISLLSFGSGVEAGPEDFVLENSRLAASVADIAYDSQVPFTRGRILDMSSKTQSSDGLDWIYTSWITEDLPAAGMADQWDMRNTRFDTLDITQNTGDTAELTATGVYASDLETHPDAKQAELTQVMTIAADDIYINVETTIINTSGTELQLCAGDVLDYDSGGTQATYIPGVGQLSNPYDSPIVVTPDEPWVAQFGDGGADQIYAMIYDEADFTAFGSVSSVGACFPVRLADGESFTYSRKLLVADSTPYLNAWDAVSAFLSGQETGFNVDISLEDKVYDVGEYATIHIALENSSDAELDNFTAGLTLPYFLVPINDELSLGSIPAGETKDFSIQARAIEAGRGSIRVSVKPEDGIPMVYIDQVSVSGIGWYGGDSHSHTTYSDGTGSIEDNANSAYVDGLSWLYATDHNSIRQYQDTEIVTANSNGDFVSIAGNELTSNIGHALGYNIPYAESSIYAVSGLTRISEASNGQRTWQDVIDEVKADGGLLFVAHPNYPGLEFDDIYDIRNYDGVEVWNGFYHALDDVNTVAFDYWDEINARGESKYYGIANSDGHNTGKIGDPYIVTYMSELAIGNVNENLANGNYFGTNGPQLRFHIDGVDMGKTRTITENGQTARVHLRAFDPNYELTKVTLYKLSITGATELTREVVQTWDLVGQNIQEWIKTVELSVSDGEFYRMEVQSTQGTSGTGGKGTGSGTGFAFSNPIWIELGSADNATEVTSMSYDATGSDANLLVNPAGNYYLTAYANALLDAEHLIVSVSDGALVEKSYDDTADVFNVTVTSADGANTQTYSLYVIRFEDTYF